MSRWVSNRYSIEIGWEYSSLSWSVVPEYFHILDQALRVFRLVNVPLFVPCTFFLFTKTCCYVIELQLLSFCQLRLLEVLSYPSGRLSHRSFPYTPPPSLSIREVLSSEKGRTDRWSSWTVGERLPRVEVDLWRSLPLSTRRHRRIKGQPFQFNHLSRRKMSRSYTDKHQWETKDETPLRFIGIE